VYEEIVVIFTPFHKGILSGMVVKQGEKERILVILVKFMKWKGISIVGT
jgi:hypothetical protein